ncbi:MAG: hypothetical protein ACRDPX_11510 [Gaiellaceae bacterium]
MSAADRVELELGFENGGLLRCAVEPTEAAQVVRAFRDDPGGLVAIDAEKGRLVIDLRRVAYVRELARRDSIGFGLRAT